MDFNQKEILISEEIKPFWQLLIAGIFYVVTLYFLYLVFHYWSIRWIHYGIECLEFALTMLSGALSFSVRNIMCLNTETKILKIKYQVGNIKLGCSEISDLKIFKLKI
jgi:hypothetical protein